jgi:hypothetical protein
MHTWARAAVVFAAAVWVAVTLVGAVSIYGFGQYELAWGRGASLQVYTWIATGVAFASCFGAGVGFRLGGSAPGAPGAVAAGLVALVLSVGALALVTYPNDLAPLYLGAAFFLLPAVVAYARARWWAGVLPVLSNTSLERTRDG